MIKTAFFAALALALITSTDVKAQPEVLTLHLFDAIDIAISQSPDAMMARHRYRGSYWQHRNYMASFMPMLNVDATIPDLNRSISSVTQPDGSEAFRERSYMSSSVNFGLTKNIGLTGGQVFMNTNLQRIDIFGDSTTTSYLTTPFNIGFRQPIFAYNPFRWSRKIEPIRYNEAQRRYVEDMEQVAITTINYFFELLQAQIRNKIQRLNLANNDTLFQITTGRYNMGTIAENELLQTELNLLNSRSALENSALDLETREFNLKSYLRLPQETIIELVPPHQTVALIIDPAEAISLARANRAAALGFDRRLLEAESEVIKARLDSRLNANLFGVYGLTQSSDEFRNAYINPQDQQRAVFGVQVPLVGWGTAKGKIKMAESSQELVKTSVEQDQIDFDQEVNIKVRQFNIQQSQLAIAARTDTVALRRYEVTIQRYMIGRIDIIDLNLAQAEKDNAALGYIAALHNYWRHYFELRRLTHYDFMTNQMLEFKEDF